MMPGMQGMGSAASCGAKAVPIPHAHRTREEMDRVLGLELGADDYVVKPFPLRELLARIRWLAPQRPGAHYRRQNPPARRRRASADRHRPPPPPGHPAWRGRLRSPRANMTCCWRCSMRNGAVVAPRRPARPERGAKRLVATRAPVDIAHSLAAQLEDEPVPHRPILTVRGRLPDDHGRRSTMTGASALPAITPPPRPLARGSAAQVRMILAFGTFLVILPPSPSGSAVKSTGPTSTRREYDLEVAAFLAANALEDPPEQLCQRVRAVPTLGSRTPACQKPAANRRTTNGTTSQMMTTSTTTIPACDGNPRRRHLHRP